METPALVTQETYNEKPILIIDKEGSIGVALYEQLKQFVQVVLVSSQEPSDTKNLLYLSFKDNIPQIPEDSYSHIFFILGDETKTLSLLEPCQKKALTDKAKLFIIASKEMVAKVGIDHLKGGRAYVLVTGDIFGVPFQKNSNIFNTLFKQAKLHHRITLAGVGLTTMYPALFADVIKAFLQIAFGSQRPDTFLLYPSYAVTQLGIAHSLQKVDPQIRIDFTHQEEQQQPENISGEFLFHDEYDVFKKLQDSYLSYVLPKEEVKQEEKKRIEKELVIPVLTPKEKQSTERKWFVWPLTFMITCLVLPWIIFLTIGGSGLIALQLAKQSFEKGDSVSAQKDLGFASQSLSLATTLSNVPLTELSLVGQTQLSFSLQNTLQTLQSLTKTANTLLSDLQTVKITLQGNSTNVSVNQLVQDVSTALELSTKITNDTTLPSFMRTALKPYVTLGASYQSLLSLLPDFLGERKEMTYLLLFQNNMELRPGGGFIGSYGILTVDKGVIKEFSIHDVYDADGQLKGHVEPSFAIRRYLGSVHLYLRDSNFSPDFPTDASQAILLYGLETGQQADGVIGVDLSFVKNLLGVVGNVFVPEYQQTVTKDNFFLLTENHAEKNSFPGSTQKKDFLSSVFTALQQKLSNPSAISYLSLLQLINESIQQKDILSAFNNSALQEASVANNLSGAIWDPRPTTPGVINDFLGVNEANLGVNKVNYYVTRSISQNVTLSATGSASETTEVAYINKSNGSWPGGTYINYLRFLLPGGATLTSISLNGEVQHIVPAVTDPSMYEKKNFIPPQGLEVEQTLEKEKEEIGFLIKVPPSSQETIDISYILPRDNSSGSTLTYNGFLFKQPGIDTTPYSFSLLYDSAMTPLVLPKGFTNTNGKILFNQQIQQDIQFSLQFTRQEK